MCIWVVVLVVKCWVLWVYSVMNDSDHVCALLIDRRYWTEALSDLIELLDCLSVWPMPGSLFCFATAHVHLINVQCY